jgi:putative ABC transport system permease protein
MRVRDVGSLAGRSLWRYPLRTAMMLLAIAIGVAAVIALTAVGEGARRYVTGEFAALGTNMLIILPGKTDTAGAGLTGMLIGETARDLTLEDTMAIERSPRVTSVAPVVVGAGTASWRSRERDITIIGTTAPMRRIQHWDLAAGRFLPAMDIDIAAPVCVLGATVADELLPTTPRIGQWLRIGDNRCRVIGVLAQAGLTGGFNTDETVIMPVANAQQIFNANGVFRILAETVSRDSMQRARQDVIDLIKERHQGIEDITVITQDAVLTTFDAIFGVVTLALAGIAAISLLVAGVLIMNVMLVAVSQRTAEIGLLKALGATRSQIVWMFLAEATWLAALGAAIGLAIGTLVTYVMRAAFPILDFAAPVWASAAAISVALASGIVFGLLPARRAARLDPVEALGKG